MENHSRYRSLSFSGIISRIQESRRIKTKLRHEAMLEGIATGCGFNRENIVAVVDMGKMAPAEPFSRSVGDNDIILAMLGRSSIAIRMDGTDRFGRARMTIMEVGNDPRKLELQKGQRAEIGDAVLGEWFAIEKVFLSLTRLPADGVRLEISAGYGGGLMPY